MRTRVVWTLSLGLLCASCSSVRPEGPQNAITRTDRTASRGALLSGTLHGDKTSGCLWVESQAGPGDGDGRTQIHLYGDYVAQWPRGVVHLYRAGHLVGKEGDTVSFGGGFGSTRSAVANCPADAAQLFSGD